MNAYELAKYLEIAFYEDEDIEKAADMLRQQADRIAELEKRSEPVAWGITDEYGDIYDCICPEEHDRHEGLYTVPLYTTPQTKPLSDEEICQLWKASQEDGIGMSLGYTTQEHYFARLIEERHGIK